MKFRCGRAVADITPHAGIELTGFAGRSGPSRGIHDRLFAKAVVISDAECELAIVTTDLLGLDGDIVRTIREGAERELGIAADMIMLCSSHTHSGPATITLRGIGERDEDYIEALERGVLGSIREALANVRESVVRVGEGRCEMGVNRRERTAEGRTILGQNACGTTDPKVAVIDIEAPHSRTVLFNYACHPVVMGSSNLLVSADFPGYAARAIAGALENGVAMFVQGCCGNVNPKVVGGRFEDAEGIGGILGAEVVRVAGGSSAEEVGGGIGGGTREVELALADVPGEEEIEEELSAHRGNYASARRDGDWGAMKHAQGLMEWAEDAAALARGCRGGLRKRLEIQALRIGSVAIVAIPGEPFAEMALAIRDRSRFRHTIVAGYANGCIGYLPTPESFTQGGYEVDSAYKYYGTSPLSPSSFDEIVETAIGLCEELSQQ